ncbi:MAG: hypothetical protein J1F35_08545 [Erysipelotrichales bacterium]|nr:hypothetical protein [Erysipelotrichales bacterium]
MAIISKETFEKFTEEEKEKVREYYNSMSCDESQQHAFKILIGKENLCPEPQVKVLEQLIGVYPEYLKDIQNMADSLGCASPELFNKILAAYKIAKLIEHSYGGIVTDKEWNDELNDSGGFYTIKWSPFYHSFHIEFEDTYKCFIAFHSKQQAEEFMSYSDNVELLRQYNMV